MLGIMFTILSATLMVASFNIPKSPAQDQKLQTVRLHIDGFSKSKSGAI